MGIDVHSDTCIGVTHQILQAFDVHTDMGHLGTEGMQEHMGGNFRQRLIGIQFLVLSFCGHCQTLSTVERPEFDKAILSHSGREFHRNILISVTGNRTGANQLAFIMFLPTVSTLFVMEQSHARKGHDHVLLDSCFCSSWFRENRCRLLVSLHNLW